MSFGVLKRFTTLAEVCTKSRKVVNARDEGEDPIEARRDKKGSARVKQPVNGRQAIEAHHAVVGPTFKHKYAATNWLNPLKKYAYSDRRRSERQRHHDGACR